MPTDSPMPSPDINAPSPSTSSVSIEDLNSQNINYDHNHHILNSDKFNSTMESSNNVNNDNDVYVPTTVTKIKSFIATETYNTVQGLFSLF